MKKLVLSLLLVNLFVYASLANDFQNNEKPANEKINWVSVEEAQRLGKENPKKVFVDVYTNWCGYCKRMDATTFSDPSVIEYVNENFYAIKLNAESKKMITFNGSVLSEAELAKAFRVTGYPTIVFIDETFQYLQPVPGYRQAGDFIKMLQQFNEAKASNQ